MAAPTWAGTQPSSAAWSDDFRELHRCWLETQQMLSEEKRRLQRAEAEATELHGRCRELTSSVRSKDAELRRAQQSIEEQRVIAREAVAGREELEAELLLRCHNVVSLRRQLSILTTCTWDASTFPRCEEICQGQAVDGPVFERFSEAGLALKFYPKGSLNADRDQCSLFLLGHCGWTIKCQVFVDDHIQEQEHTWEVDGPCCGWSNFCLQQSSYSQVGVRVLRLVSPCGEVRVGEAPGSDAVPEEEDSSWIKDAEAASQACSDLECALAALLRVQGQGEGLLPKALRTPPQKHDKVSLLEALRAARPFLMQAEDDDSQYNSQDPVEKKLSNIVGLEPVKAQIRQLRKTLQLNQRKQQLGAPVLQAGPLHMVFSGGPGCGKTSVARLLAELLHESGVVQGEAFVEAQRGDLVASYVGQTASKTRAVIERAKGGVLFIDEAYRLSTSGSNDYGQEAIEELMKDLTSGDPVVCLAGYPKEMDEFLRVNPGLRRRFPLIFQFPDYTPQHIAQIFMAKARGQGYRFSDDVTEHAIAGLLEQHSTKALRALHNGALADLLLERTARALDARMPADFTKELAEVIVLIDVADASRGLMKGGRT